MKKFNLILGDFRRHGHPAHTLCPKVKQVIEIPKLFGVTESEGEKCTERKGTLALDKKIS